MFASCLESDILPYNSTRAVLSLKRGSNITFIVIIQLQQIIQYGRIMVIIIGSGEKKKKRLVPDCLDCQRIGKGGGGVLVVNLASFMLWNRFTVVEPPDALVTELQKVRMELQYDKHLFFLDLKSMDLSRTVCSQCTAQGVECRLGLFPVLWQCHRRTSFLQSTIQVSKFYVRQCARFVRICWDNEVGRRPIVTSACHWKAAVMINQEPEMKSSQSIDKTN